MMRNKSKKRLAMTLLFVLVVAPFLSILGSFQIAHAVTPTFAGPTDVTTTTDSNAGQRSLYSCYANGLFWVFYDDGTHFGFKTSPDQTSWSAETTLTTSVLDGTEISWYCNGGTVYYAGTTTVVFIYRYGSLNSDGSISWSIPETSQATTAAPEGNQGISISVDTSDNIWVKVATAVGGVDHIEVWEHTASWSKSNDFTLGATGVGQGPIIPLTSGKMAIVFAIPGGSALGLSTFDGSSTWTSISYTSATIFTKPFYNPNWLSATAVGDTVEVSDGESSPALAVDYFTFAFGGSWVGPTSIASESAGTPTAITSDGSSFLALWWAESPASIKYEYSTNSGSTWSMAATLSSAQTNPQNHELSTSMFTNAGISPVVWSSGNASPFTIRTGDASYITTVTVNLTCTIPNGVGVATLTITASDASTPSPNNPACTGSPIAITANPSITLTATEPSAGPSSRTQFTTGNTATFSTPSSGSATWSLTNYLQYLVTPAFVIAGSTTAISPAPSASTLACTQAGSIAAGCPGDWVDGNGVIYASSLTWNGIQVADSTVPDRATVVAPGVTDVATFVYQEGIGGSGTIEFAEDANTLSPVGWIGTLQQLTFTGTCSITAKCVVYSAGLGSPYYVQVGASIESVNQGWTWDGTYTWITSSQPSGSPFIVSWSPVPSQPGGTTGGNSNSGSGSTGSGVTTTTSTVTTCTTTVTTTGSFPGAGSTQYYPPGTCVIVKVSSCFFFFICTTTSTVTSATSTRTATTSTVTATVTTIITTGVTTMTTTGLTTQTSTGSNGQTTTTVETTTGTSVATTTGTTVEAIGGTNPGQIQGGGAAGVVSGIGATLGGAANALTSLVAIPSGVVMDMIEFIIIIGLIVLGTTTMRDKPWLGAVLLMIGIYLGLDVLAVGLGLAPSLGPLSLVFPNFGQTTLPAIAFETTGVYIALGVIGGGAGLGLALSGKLDEWIEDLR